VNEEKVGKINKIMFKSSGSRSKKQIKRTEKSCEKIVKMKAFMNIKKVVAFSSRVVVFSFS
jgi:hypothetical protein